MVVAATSTLLASDLATPDKLALALFILDHRLCFEAATTAKEVTTIPSTTLSTATATCRPHNPCYWVLSAVIWTRLDVNQALLVHWERFRTIL